MSTRWLINELELITNLKNKAVDNIIKVYETFDKNKPELLIDEINRIKKNL